MNILGLISQLIGIKTLRLTILTIQIILKQQKEKEKKKKEKEFARSSPMG